ncbi:MAG: bifunctional folylpolyglutamate synthase/dihydrofolate synthase [Erysipelotrichaceae bacterium]
MFDDLQQALDWVMSRRKTHRFEQFQQFMQDMGNPQLQLKCLHVAGTNGKGSTTNYLRSILQRAGYKVGSFTSPHLVTHLDRIRINDENIDGDYFLNCVNQYYQTFIRYELSMFEIDMFISVCYFLARKVDIAVYEVGMGGRLDNTNVISPIGAVITNIEMDHMNILGDSIEKIAYEKAGIIKAGIDVVTFERKKQALEVFRDKCRQQKANLVLVDQPENVEITDHISFDFHNKKIELPTMAAYQILNSTAAITAIELLRDKGLIEVSDEQIIEGLQTGWAGRFEIISKDPLIIIDGAHNVNGIEALCQSLDNLHQELVIVFSALKDKEYREMINMLLSKGEVIVTEFENHRMQTAEKLAQGTDCLVIDDYKAAIETAINTNKAVVITGSLYFISDAREYLLGRKKV